MGRIGNPEYSFIGRPVIRKEGIRKVTGEAQYVDDLHFSGMLYGATVRNPAARGTIRRITFDEGLPWEEFTIVTARDVPCENCVALILHDQPLLAHPDRYLVEEARRRVGIHVDPLPGVFSLEDSIAQKEIIWGEDNVFKTFRVEKGDVERGFAEAD